MKISSETFQVELVAMVKVVVDSRKDEAIKNTLKRTKTLEIGDTTDGNSKQLGVDTQEVYQVCQS